MTADDTGGGNERKAQWKHGNLPFQYRVKRSEISIWRMMISLSQVSEAQKSYFYWSLAADDASQARQ